MAVTPSAIAVALGRATGPSDTEWAQWDMWINDARRLIRRRHADLEALDQDDLDYVVREAVTAHIRRPDDATTVEVRVDDGSVGKTYRTSAGRVTIRAEWWDLLDPNGGRGKAFSITPYSSGAAHLPWCSLMLGATYCSCGVDIAGYPIFEGAEE